MPTPTRRPRIVYCTDTYPPQVNGVSVVTALSVRGLMDRGWSCAVIAPAYPDSEPSLDIGPASVVSIPSVAMPVYPDLRLSAPDYGTIRTTIGVFEPDVVHCATEFVIGALGQRAALRSGIPVVSSYHTDFGRYAAAYGAPWLRGTVNRYLAAFHRRNALTFTPSAPAQRDLTAMGVRHASVWGRGVDTTLFSPSRRDYAMRTSYSRGAPFLFLHVGRLAAEKNVNVIVEAYRLATRLLPRDSIRLVIAGSGPEEKKLRAMAPDDVVFLGVLDRDRELPRLYASADAFLFASLTETLGLVILEAMASGLPVVAAPAGGVADHLRHFDNGMAVPPSDPVAMAHAMVQLATDETLRQRLSTGARQTAAGLSWDSELDRLDAAYRDLIGADVSKTRVA